MSATKDPPRFDLYLQVLQERVAFDDKILLPLAEHLFVVARDGQRVVKCDCGCVFGPVDRNWKRETRILVRDSEAVTTRPASQPAAQPRTSQGATDHYCPARSSAYPADRPNVVIAHQPMMNDCLHAGAPQHSRIMTLSARPHLHPPVWIHRTV